MRLKTLHGQEQIEEINLARANNIGSQRTLARTMIDTLESFRRPVSAIEYEVLGYALTTAGEDALRDALAKASGEPMLEGYVHQIRGQALHAVRNTGDARLAFDRADASYAKIASPSGLPSRQQRFGPQDCGL